MTCQILFYVEKRKEKENTTNLSSDELLRLKCIDCITNPLRACVCTCACLSFCGHYTWPSLLAKKKNPQCV